MSAITPFINVWLLGVGFFLLIFLGFFSGFVRALQSRRWPQTQGRVTESEVRESSRQDDDSSHKLSYSYEPRVCYSYTVDGKILESRQIAIGVVLGSKADAAKVIARYPVGARVTVYHHARKPYLAVLEPGGWLLPLLVTLVSGTVLGFVVMIWIHKSLRPNCEPWSRPAVEQAQRSQ
jgi:hypothetical protein